MKKVYIGQNLKKENVYWELLNSNSLYLSGLSGTGKSYLANNIISQFLKNGYEVIIISSKAKVDFKQDVQRIRPREDLQELKEFIIKMNSLILSSKTEVEDSKYSHLAEIREQKVFIVLDELWEFEKLDKEIKKDFNDLIELFIRQTRYLSINVMMLSQTAKTSETSIPIRQSKNLVIGKTDTAEASSSLLDSDIAYKAPLKMGQFIFWNRKNKPEIISVIPEKISLFKRIWKLLLKEK